MYRTHTCNELTKNNIGENVTLAGFVAKVRDLGSMIFIDLRDHYGITQIVVRAENLKKIASNLVKESTIKIKGEVVQRESVNNNIYTGDIEVIANDIEILSVAVKNLPFEINEEYKNNKEDLRLKYRFLDLRNNKIHQNIIRRAKIMKDMRAYMDNAGFLEIQTPIFANSSPEGARDYLIPSRLHPGEFYALPQAPQQFKQLLMVSGFDKYYQIAPCFRDEDPRADRSPCEFYQLDFEMSFATQEDVFKVLEGLLYDVFTKNTTKKVDKIPFRKIPYNTSMELYGIDKPDLRHPLINVNVTEELKDVDIYSQNTSYMILIPKTFSRKTYDKLTEKLKKDYGATGLGWVKIENNECSGGISKFITDDIYTKLINKHKQTEQLAIDNNYTKLAETKEMVISDYSNYSIFVISDKDKKVAQTLAGNLRIELAEVAELIDTNEYRFCFITDFPMYEETDDAKLDFAHNPFSMPQCTLEEIRTKNPLDILAYQYDVVCNGFEITSGAVRNHDISMMEEVFGVLGYTKEELIKRFKALYTAFQYGAPPHAGAAPGLDRIVMLLNEETNLREVIAFPKNKKARDQMIDAPSKISDEQLEELHISVIKEHLQLDETEDKI